MGKLIVLGFNHPHQADEVLHSLNKLQKQELIDLEDAAIVIHKSDGKVKLKQSNDLIAGAAVGGSFWGLLIGALFLMPIAGLALGAATGAAAGAASDIGIDDSFMKEVGETIKPGSSAIFILVKHAQPDKVIQELKPFGGTLLHTNLSTSDENKLKKALAY